MLLDGLLHDALRPFHKLRVSPRHDGLDVDSWKVGQVTENFLTGLSGAVILCIASLPLLQTGATSRLPDLQPGVLTSICCDWRVLWLDFLRVNLKRVSKKPETALIISQQSLFLLQGNHLLGRKEQNFYKSIIDCSAKLSRN